MGPGTNIFFIKYMYSLIFVTPALQMRKQNIAVYYAQSHNKTLNLQRRTG